MCFFYFAAFQTLKKILTMCFIMWTKQKVSYLTIKRPYMLHNTKSTISIENRTKKKIVSRCFIMWKKMLYNVAQVSYFFISPEKLIFDNFLAKIEWVREICVFFAVLFFFLVRPLKMSEWVKCKLFRGRKTKQNVFRFFL